jgi:hypothetical protein
LRRIAQFFVTESDLLIILGIHEMVMRSIGIEIFHLVLLEGRPLYGVG